MATCVGEGDVARNLVPSIYNGLCADEDGRLFHSLYQILPVLGNIIQMLLTVIAVLAVIFITYSGIKYIMSEGDPTKTAQAKDGIRNSILGLILSAAAYLIIEFVVRQFV